MCTWEQQWSNKTEPFSAVPRGDEIAVTARLWKKYHDAQ
jgi:hypothetical protein